MELVGLHGDALKIKVTSPPVEGKANEQLRAALADWLDIPVSHVTLRSGHTGRQKTLEITGLTAQGVESRLLTIG